MPRAEEEKIRELCAQAIAANDNADVDRILRELRLEIAEYVRLARESLLARAAVLATLNGDTNLPTS